MYRLSRSGGRATGTRGRDEVLAASPGSKFSRILELQRLAGNAAVSGLLRDESGARERAGVPPVSERVSGKAARAEGPTAVTLVGGRALFDDGTGSAGDVAAAAMTTVATITGSSMVRHDDEQASRPPGGADIEYGSSRPAVAGHSLDEQLDIVFEAVMRARRMLDAGFAALMGADSLPERSMDSLDRNFHNVDRSQSPTRVSHLDDIRNSIAKTRAPFDDPVPVEIESDGDGRVLGYVNVYKLFGPHGNIHLMPLWFTKDADYRAQVIVHEACHRFDNDDDHAYRWDSAKYGSLSVEEAIDNADSYAWFCDDVS